MRVTLFLAGDVMTGRGIDQILAAPSDPRLHESYVRDARVYVQLAERVNGPVPRRVNPEYVWGTALELLERVSPAVRVVNLETSVTRPDEYCAGKSIHYRMNPANVDCLTAAKIDCCVLANNHVLDWGRAGLVETLATLAAAGLRSAGAGADTVSAATPAIVDLGSGTRVLVFSWGSDTSGIPLEWAAGVGRPGVALLKDLSRASARQCARHVAAYRRPGDVVVASVHWGSNWGYSIPNPQREFAHELVDSSSVDIVHGHSAHHAKAIEVYRGRPVLYGCGDFINDYEGISGHRAYRDDLALAYLPTIDSATGTLADFRIKPAQLRNFSLRDASHADAEWIRAMLDREGVPFGTRFDLDPEGMVRWRGA